jgi:hypothetical protein
MAHRLRLHAGLRARSEDPRQPGWATISWALDQLNGGAARPSEADVSARFAPEFLAAVMPASDVVASLAQTAAERGPFTFTGFPSPPTATKAIALIQPHRRLPGRAHDRLGRTPGQGRTGHPRLQLRPRQRSLGPKRPSSHPSHRPGRRRRSARAADRRQGPRPLRARRPFRRRTLRPALRQHTRRPSQGPGADRRRAPELLRAAHRHAQDAAPTQPVARNAASAARPPTAIIDPEQINIETSLAQTRAAVATGPAAPHAAVRAHPRSSRPIRIPAWTPPTSASGDTYKMRSPPWSRTASTPPSIPAAK